jgi:hypothetical protein
LQKAFSEVAQLQQNQRWMELECWQQPMPCSTTTGHVVTHIPAVTFTLSQRQTTTLLLLLLLL